MQLPFPAYFLCLLQLLSVAWSAPLLPTDIVPRTHTLDQRGLSEFFSKFKLKKTAVDVARKGQTKPKGPSIWKKIASFFARKPKVATAQDGTEVASVVSHQTMSTKSKMTAAQKALANGIKDVSGSGVMADPSSVLDLKILAQSPDPKVKGKAKAAMDAYESAQKQFEERLGRDGSVVYHYPMGGPSNALPQDLAFLDGV
ncbi:hypothetical protein FRB94_002892 [Tulasnella sp. JGI-2019a]|nr:hypothetical protein FRB93_006062 [Tulasnella sp. JGI-2019a]KAG8986316.1 hypothetical protein FRB94_002892 [Tulasnella sp. JGI-2019a]KAG9025257.1 hypothetical protein FRB95_010377 [Tulasnella sp. JGI-2019a]